MHKLSLTMISMISSGSRQIHSIHPKEHQVSPDNYCSLPSEGSRSHGSCIHGNTFGPPTHEIISVVSQSQGSSSKVQSPEANKGYAPGATHTFYLVQTPVGPCCHRKMLMRDASLIDWGAVSDGRPAQEIGSGHLLDWHINCLKIMALFRDLKYFLHQLRGYHVLKRVPEQASAAGSTMGTGQVPIPQDD